MTPTDARFRDEDVGPGRLGGFAEVGIKLLHARVVELIEEQEEVVDAAQSMIPFIVDCALPSIVIDRIKNCYISFSMTTLEVHINNQLTSGSRIYF